MHKTVEAIIDPNGHIRLLESVKLSHPRRALVTILEEVSEDEAQLNETTLLSEAALAEDWNRPEEDEAWQHLQSER